MRQLRTMRNSLAMLVLLAVAPLCALPAAANVVTVNQGLAYGDLPRQQFDIYRPAALDDDTPVVVFFYGGGWERGDRGDVRETGEALAASGMIVAVPDYRLYPDVAFPVFVKDVAQAVAHVWRSERRADGSARPVFIGGHSAGAFNAALVALDESYLSDADMPPGALAGAILLSGPYDYSGSLPPPFDEIFPPETRAASAAAEFVDSADPPILLLTGDADDDVDPVNTRSLADAIEAGGGDVSVVVYPGVRDHLATFRGLADAGSLVRRDIETFMDAALDQWRRWE